MCAHCTPVQSVRAGRGTRRHLLTLSRRMHAHAELGEVPVGYVRSRFCDDDDVVVGHRWRFTNVGSCAANYDDDVVAGEVTPLCIPHDGDDNAPM